MVKPVLLFLLVLLFLTTGAPFLTCQAGAAFFTGPPFLEK